MGEGPVLTEAPKPQQQQAKKQQQQGQKGNGQPKKGGKGNSKQQSTSSAEEIRELRIQKVSSWSNIGAKPLHLVTLTSRDMQSGLPTGKLAPSHLIVLMHMLSVLRC